MTEQPRPLRLTGTPPGPDDPGVRYFELLARRGDTTSGIGVVFRFVPSEVLHELFDRHEGWVPDQTLVDYTIGWDQPEVVEITEAEAERLIEAMVEETGRHWPADAIAVAATALLTPDMGPVGDDDEAAALDHAIAEEAAGQLVWDGWQWLLAEDVEEKGL